MYKQIVADAETEKRTQRRRGEIKRRRVILFQIILANCKKLVEIHIDDPAKAKATSDQIGSIVYAIAELMLGERPEKL